MVSIKKIVPRFSIMMASVIAILTAAIVMCIPMFTQRALANLPEDLRTVPLNDQGEMIVTTHHEFRRGGYAFQQSCNQCHLRGYTKTNPNITLSPSDLANATPPRNNLLGLMDYIQSPTTYDGEEDISEFHPTPMRPDIWPDMRNLTEDDVKALAGYILISPKIDSRWGQR